MIYALILAGGTGTRMGNQGMPKQFLTLNDKPIIIHTIEKYLKMSFIDKYVVVCHEDYCQYMSNLIIEYNLGENICIVEGGQSRMESIENGIKYMLDNYKISKKDVFISIDSVRPIVDENEIKELVNFSKKYLAVTIVNAVKENIIQTNENEEIMKIYSRNRMYKDLSPQAFNIIRFYELLKELSDEEKERITDLCELFVNKNEKVRVIEGSTSNIKITTPIDLKIAKELI